MLIADAKSVSGGADLRCDREEWTFKVSILTLKSVIESKMIVLKMEIKKCTLSLTCSDYIPWIISIGSCKVKGDIIRLP